MAAAPEPQKVLILLDVDDPLTRDRDFVRGIEYSPWVVHADEISERHRKVITKRDANEDQLENPLANRFVIELKPQHIGDFVTHFVVNPTHQRALVFIDYSYEPLPEEEQTVEDLVEDSIRSGQDVEDVLQNMKCGLLHVYLLRSGGPIPDVDDEEDQDEDEDSEDDEQSGIRSYKAKSGDSHMLESDLDDDMQDLAEDLNLSGSAFAVAAPKSVH